MTTLNTIENAANKAAVIEANFELIDALLTLLANGTGNIRIKDNNLQVKDNTAVADVGNTTHHWRTLSGDDGILGLSEALQPNE